MPYSMVGTPALGYDLARLPRGEQVATVVRTGLRCSPRDLRRLAARHPGPLLIEQAAAQTSGIPEAMASALHLADRAFDAAANGHGSDGAAILHRLEQASLGSAAALDRFLRDDVLAWAFDSDGTEARVAEGVATRAADVLVAAAVSGFSTDADARARRSMATPFLGAGLDLVDGSTPTGHLEVDQMLRTLTVCDAETRAAWRDAVERRPADTLLWAPAMHQATWALSLTERLSLAADVQMAAVVAFRAAGFTARDASYGAWNALSGALQAALVIDLLPEPETETLMRVWRQVYAAA